MCSTVHIILNMEACVHITRNPYMCSNNKEVIHVFIYKEIIQVLAHFKYANQLNLDMGELRNGSKFGSYTSCM